MTVSRLREIQGTAVDRTGGSADRAHDPETPCLENMDTDLGPPPLAATHEAIGRDDCNSYLPFTGHASLRQAAAAHVSRLSRVSYEVRHSNHGFVGRVYKILFSRIAIRSTVGFTIGTLCVTFFPYTGRAEKGNPPQSVVVQPGPPGSPTKLLPSSTKGVLPSLSAADVQFMQGMILHHAQAVEMTAMISSNTENRDLHSLGARISSSQTEEIKFMKHWLKARRAAVPKAIMPGMNMSSKEAMPLMPGMLTPVQMEALAKAKGGDFDRLFLKGMIQHHSGALTMVKDLFATAGAGQDAELFDFATDADNTQRAEIKIMESMLKQEEAEEER